MKHTAMVMLLAAGSCGYAKVAPIAAENRVAVCVPARVDLSVTLAKDEARKMFAAIAVALDWRDSLACPADALRVTLDAQTPADFRPHALAYALPYEGTHIHVFYDRIQAAVPAGSVRHLLAHVLVHEISHILEGAARHSDAGIMKASWDQADYNSMAWKPLAFTSIDVYLIRRGLAGRSGTLAQFDARASGSIELGNDTPNAGN